MLPLISLIYFVKNIQNPAKHLVWNFFPELINGFELYSVYYIHKSSILDALLSSEYASVSIKDVNV